VKVQRLKLASFRVAQHGIQTFATEFCARHGFVGVLELRENPMSIPIRRFVALALLIGIAFVALQITAKPRVAGCNILA
jgi:hypothetical protein